MREILHQYFNKLIEFKIYPFVPLEVNFLINFSWVILRSIFKAGSDYRAAKLTPSESTGGGIFTFVEFKILVFILSFLITFMIALSLDFWFTYLDIKNNVVWWLPSFTAVGLAEISGLLANLFKKEEEEQIEKTSRILAIYFISSFILLVLFWLFMFLRVS